MEITVSKTDLLDILRANRAKHRETFEAALQGYAAEAKNLLEKHLESLRQGRTPAISIILDRPEDRTRDYSRVIGMLEMHQGDTFTLDETSYAQYVDDDWQWKRQWLKLSSAYAPESVTKNYAVGG